MNHVLVGNQMLMHPTQTGVHYSLYVNCITYTIYEYVHKQVPPALTNYTVMRGLQTSQAQLASTTVGRIANPT
jgi:hypothetical protein